MIVPCAHCGGDGIILHELGYDYVYGTLMQMLSRCEACDGTGCEWAEGEPLDEDDIPEWIGEPNANL